jgi:hypothetical protein
MIYFHQILDFWFIIFIKFSTSQFIIFIKFSTFFIKESFSNFLIQMKSSLHVIKCMQKRHLSVIVNIIKSDVMIEIEDLMKINYSNDHSKNRFWIFSYRWKFFFACYQIHTNMTLNDDCTKMIYRERRTRRLYFDQVFNFSIHHFHQVSDFLDQRIVFEFFHADEIFFEHVIKFIQKWHWIMIVRRWFIERKKRADFILIKFSISQFIIFIKSLIFSIRKSFSDFFIQMKNFFACHQMHAKTTLINDCKYYRK